MYHNLSIKKNPVFTAQARKSEYDRFFDDVKTFAKETGVLVEKLQDSMSMKDDGAQGGC